MYDPILQIVSFCEKVTPPPVLLAFRNQTCISPFYEKQALIRVFQHSAPRVGISWYINFAERVQTPCENSYPSLSTDAKCGYFGPFISRRGSLQSPCSMSTSKTKLQKSISWPLFWKRGVSKLQTAIWGKFLIKTRQSIQRTTGYTF